MALPAARPPVAPPSLRSALGAGLLAIAGAVAAVVAGHAAIAAAWLVAWVVGAHLLLIPAVLIAVDAAGDRVRSGAGRTVGRGMRWLVTGLGAEARRIVRVVDEQRRLAVACAVGALGSMVLTGPAMWRMAQGRANGYLANDWLPFDRAVHETGFWPLKLTTPHFVFPTVGAIVRVATATTPATATALTGIASVGITGAVLVWFFHRPWAGGEPLSLSVAVIATLAFEVSDLPQYLFFGRSALTFDRLNVSLHQWNTPSSVAVEWMQLVLLISVARLGSGAAPGRRWTAWVAVLTLVTTLTLPAVPAALSVGAPIWLWRSGRLDRFWLFVRAVIAPMVLALALAVAESILWLKPGWDPPLIVELGGSMAKLDLWGPGLMLLVPVALVALMGWRSFCEPDEVRLTGWSLAWAMLLLLTLALGGPRASEGNIGRVAFGASWIGYLFMVRWTLELARGWRSWSTWPVRRQVATPLVLAYVAITMVGGALMLLEQSGAIVFTGASI